MAQSPKATAALEAPLPGFSVSLNNFNGPFDLLLTLISKHELDITEISLSVVTGEFIAYLRELDSVEELDQATEFLVVAATLLDLKVAGGDLNVRVQVEVPTKLNGEQQEKLRAFSESIGDYNSPMQEGFFQKAKRFFDL